MKTISFYTDPTYKAMAEKMEASASKVGLDVKLYDLTQENQATKWGHILFWKPKLILRAMDEFPGQDILWVDSDVTWLRPPELLFQIPQHKWLACHVEGTRHLWGVLIWVRNSPGGREMMEAWIKENEQVPGSLDDHNAYCAWMRCGYRGRIQRLPRTYCWTEAIMRRRFPGAVPVLEHDLHVTLGNRPLRATATERPYMEG